MIKKTSIAVLLTCHNRKEKTLKCLSNLFKNDLTGVSITVFLVDDKCTDGTIQMVNRYYPQVIVLEGSGDLFWNRGMYLAWKIASQNQFDSYLWLNDDTYLKTDALKIIYGAHLKKPKSIIVGTLLHDSKDDNRTISYGGRSLKNRDDIIIPDGRFLQKCDIFNGNCVLVPELVFQKIGNLDYYFRHSFGDFEYGLRSMKNNIDSYVVSDFVGYCKKDIIDGKFNFLNKKYNIRNRFKLLYSPLGKNPYEAFYLNRKYNSFIYSIAVFLKLHYNVIFKSNY